ncbi:MAG TPA: HEAT repeat domain-containing protein [Sedimentisphaerales bacterium]|nr:HEAT repeat domain-containing protein [Sedimentisphaerales bacterium]
MTDSDITEKNIDRLIRSAGPAIHIPPLRRADILQRLTGKTAQEHKSIWRIVMKSKIVKLTAAAAVIIIAVVLGLTYWLPTGGPVPGEEMDTEIEIPPELAQMPVEKLLEIHFGKAESPFDSRLVTAVLAKALDKLSAREVLDIGRKYKREFPEESDSAEAYYPPAVSAVVEASDFVVHAHVDDVTLDLSDIKQAILNPPPLGEDIPGHVKATVDLRVLEAYPSLPPEFAENIRLSPVLTTESLDMFEQGREYMIALRKDGDIIWNLWGWEGVYPVDTNSQTVSGSAFRYTSMPLEETWQLIMDCYDAIHKGIQASEETLDFWLEKLQSANFTDCWSAVEYFSTLREPPVPPELLLDAIQKQLSIGFTDDELEKYHPRAFIIEALDLFDMVADEPTTEKLLDFYAREASSPGSILSTERVRFNHISYRETHSPIASVGRLVLKHLGLERCKEIVRDPSAFGLDKAYEIPVYLQKVLGNRDQPNHSTRLQKEQDRKQNIQDLINTYGQGDTSVIRSIAEQVTSEDTEFIPFFREQADTHEGEIATMIAAKLPDPCFIPIIRKALEQGLTVELLKALYACGARQEAVEKAAAEMEKTPNWEIIEFLGTTGDTSVLPLIEDFTHPEMLEPYRDESDEFWQAPHLQRIAVLALARLGGELAIPRLKEIYESENADILVRIATALSLYSLGDDTGYELLEYFVDGAERSIPELEQRWGGDIGSGEAFSPITGYLRSPRTDALLLECLRRGGVDAYTLRSSSSFFIDHEREILPILVDNLESKDRKVRSHASKVLKRVTGQDFGFKPERFAGQQNEAVGRWRSYVEDYLAKSTSLGE